MAYNEDEANTTHLGRGKLGNKHRTKRVAETKAQGGQELAAKDHVNGGAEVLENDAADANNAGHDDGLLSADKVADNAGCKGGREEANGAGGVDKLLVGGLDDPNSVDLVAEVLGEGSHGKELSNHGNLIAEVDGEEIDDKT